MKQTNAESSVLSLSGVVLISDFVEKIRESPIFTPKKQNKQTDENILRVESTSDALRCASNLVVNIFFFFFFLVVNIEMSSASGGLTPDHPTALSGSHDPPVCFQGKVFSAEYRACLSE